MLRPMLALALIALATPCLAQTAVVTAPPADRDARQIRPSEQQPARGDRFVVQSDACGASRYRHLLNEDWRAHEITMPDNVVIMPSYLGRTLEYTPHQLNVVLDENGRIVSIGCY